MRTVIVRDAMRIPLGKQGENNAVRVVWPEIAEKYAKLYGEGRFELVVVQRGQVYLAVVNVDGADLVWDVRAADTATAEVGSLELIYYVGDTIAKSQTWETVVVASASAAGTTEPPEDPARVWFDEIKRQIGDLGKLTTKAKENLVGAINEAAQTSSGGADWAQNDPTAKDYVKNRTHWVDNDGTVHKLDEKFLPESATPEQAQADWDEQNEDAPGYIRNKPTFGAVVVYEGSVDNGDLILCGVPTSEMTYAEADALIRKNKPFLIDGLGNAILDAQLTDELLTIYQIIHDNNGIKIGATNIAVTFKPEQTNTNTSTSTSTSTST